MLKERCVMKLLGQLSWIFFFSLLGEGISTLLAVPIPGSVVGMVLLFFALHFKLLEMKKVEEAGNWLVHNMAILFVPAGVGLMVNFDIFATIWWQLLIIVLFSTVVMIVVVGQAVQWLKKRKRVTRFD